MLSIPKIDQPIQLIYNQMLGARLGINTPPLSITADDKKAEIIQNIIRAIERDSNAQMARAWAFKRAITCGRGFYRVNTRWDDSSDNMFDQKLTIERILHQDSVYMDPTARECDYSDAEYGFITTWVPLTRMKALFPGTDVAKNADQTFAGLMAENAGWAEGEGEERSLLVAEYFTKEHKIETYCLLEDGQIVKAKDVDGRKVMAERRKDDIVVKWAKICGMEPLEESEWNGKYIPIIPVWGRELLPFDGERQWNGIITNNKGAQQFYNFSASSLVERIALEPRAPFVAYQPVIEGYENDWRDANVRNIPVLRANVVVEGGTLLPLPQRAPVDGSAMSIAAMALQQADAMIQSGTATYDPSLGRVNQREKSGRAIMALQEQSDATSSDYLHMLANVSMAYEAKVILNALPQIYDRKGRIVPTLSLNEDTEFVMLNQPFIIDKETHKPRAIPVAVDRDGKPIEPLQPLPGALPGPQGLGPGMGQVFGR
jgi:hypothetical protein